MAEKYTPESLRESIAVVLSKSGHPEKVVKALLDQFTLPKLCSLVAEACFLNDIAGDDFHPHVARIRKALCDLNSRGQFNFNLTDEDNGTEDRSPGAVPIDGADSVG